MKKVSLFLVMSSLFIACASPSIEATVPVADSTVIDTTASTVIDTTAVVAPDSIAVDTTSADTACDC